MPSNNTDGSSSDNGSSRPPSSTNLMATNQNQDRTTHTVLIDDVTSSSSPPLQEIPAFLLSPSVADMAVGGPAGMSPLSPASPLSSTGENISSLANIHIMQIRALLHRLQQLSLISTEGINDGEGAQRPLSLPPEQQISISITNEQAVEHSNDDNPGSTTVRQAAERPSDELS